MALSKVTYVDGVTIIGAKNLNDIQDELIRQGEQQADDEAELALKANTADVQTALALKADKTETYTKAQVDSIVEDAIAEAVKESEYSNFEMKSVSGDFIHITDGAGLIPVKDLKIGIDAVQEGTGDPSPENVRPITGWTGAKVSVNGVNQWDEEWEVGAIANATGENSSLANNIRSKNYIPVVGGKEYYVKAPTGVYLRFYDKDKSYLGSDKSINNYHDFSFTSPVEAKFIRFYLAQQTYNHDISINYPSTEKDYHAYDGNTYEVTWQTEAGTVYGGTLDVTTGELTITFVSTDLTQNMNVGDIGGIYVYYKELSPLPKVVSNAEPANVIAEAYTKIRYNGVTGSIGTIAIRTNNYIYVNTGGRDISPTGKAIYELVTPQTYQLTPTEVLTLLGENNIFADTGAVEELIYRISRQ